MRKIKVNKGHNINISGLSSREYSAAQNNKFVSITPLDFNYIKPKMIVKENDIVKMGDPIFFDKLNPEIKWPSIASGKISKIELGERRAIQKIIIEIDKNEESKIVPSKVDLSSREQVKDFISSKNMWPFITQRPFNKVVNPTDNPKSIIVSLVNSAPLSTDLSFTLDSQNEYVIAALSKLKKLTDGKLYVAVNKNEFSYLSSLDFVEVVEVEGPHPAGNIGVILNKIDPINANEVVWTVKGFHLPMLGKLFSKGYFDPSISINIAGPAVKPTYVKSRLGSSFAPLKNNLIIDNVRVISGDVLTGKQVSIDGFLGFYHSMFSIIEESFERPFIGWLHPGGKSKYSVFNAYFGSNKKSFNFTTLQNGSNRAFVPIDAWEKVFPMDIHINALARSIEANDIDEMEQLGIYECDEEDVALCSFVCPSKSDVGSIIRRGLDTIYFDQ
tara:strand:- start:274 stop:1602 length:1329 start_codon:yes stop_codon:yes gene_type:complete